MKTIMLALSLLLLFNCKVAAQNTLPKEVIELKIKHYTNLKLVGNVIAYTGGAVTITGLYLFSKTINSNFYSADFNQHLIGAGLTIIGVGLIAGGATTATIANFKKKKYRQQLNGITFMPLLSPSVNGFCLQYRF